MLDLKDDIRQWAQQLGFDQVGFTDLRLDDYEQHLHAWIEKGYHGDMDYMFRHGSKRTHPDHLVEGTVSIISVRMNYLPPNAEDSWQVMSDSSKGFISRYALGRDYHKVMRKRLQKLADRIQERIGAFGYRAFVDSAPVMEKALAEKAGLGWIGKHTNLLHSRAGSWFFLGELYTDLPLQADDSTSNHCGSCRKCIDVCPTQAIVSPYQLDARRCISYLTIEHKGSIPVPFRKAMGNRIYGCDDCQLICPWNKFAKVSELPDFAVRNKLDQPELVDLFAWSEEQFLCFTQGSAIRRIGYQRWLRNLAVALGNAKTSNEVFEALKARLDCSSALVREHIVWALQQHPVSA